VDCLGGFGRRFEEQGEGEADSVVGVGNAAVVEAGESGAGGDGEVEGGREAVVLGGGGGGGCLLFAAAGAGIDGGRVEGEQLVGVCFEAQVEGQIDGGSGLEVGEGSDGGVGLADAGADEAAGGANAEFDIRREDAEALFEVVVEVVSGLAGPEAVGGVAGRKPN
jgi:hypothetical protein